MTQKISGQNFDINLGDIRVFVSKATLDITDNSAVAQTRGLPNGHVDGDVSASGELEVPLSQRANIVEAARNAGSFQRLPAFDVVMTATAGDDTFKVEAFGCRIKISSLVDMEDSGGSEATLKLPFDVTDSDFVHIDGVPYLDPATTKALSG